MINRHLACLMLAITIGLAAVALKNPSPDENLLAQGVAPAIHIQRSVLVLHELEPHRRLGDALTGAMQARHGNKGL